MGVTANVASRISFGIPQWGLSANLGVHGETGRMSLGQAALPNTLPEPH